MTHLIFVHRTLHAPLFHCPGTLTHTSVHHLPCCRQAGGAPLEEIAASFARFFGSIDLEKLDVVVGFVLVQVLQVSCCTCCCCSGSWRASCQTLRSG